MVSEMLGAAGFRTGTFRSPHLQHYTERISIGGDEISEDEWAHHFNTVLPVADGMRSDAFSGYRLGRPTLFELLFAIAALHFREKGIEWAVLEAGLGGRLDATNLVQSEVAVITNVSLEHTRVLGRTIPEIAAEKAAIIKPGASAATGAEGEALDVIERRAADVGSPLLVSGRDIQMQSSPGKHGQVLRLEGRSGALLAQLPSSAAYQARNAAVAFGVAMSLRERGVSLADGAIRQGLERFAAPGRFETLPGEPAVLLDGAHNPAGMEALAESLGERRMPLLFAAMEDKDIETMVGTISRNATRAIVTRVPGTDRSAHLGRMAAAFRADGVETVEQPEAGAALELALRSAERGTLLVTGSLYLVGFVRERLLQVPA
jgi:dihydrofolate synthase/folylpolyglutamate synthase